MAKLSSAMCTAPVHVGLLQERRETFFFTSCGTMGHETVLSTLLHVLQVQSEKEKEERKTQVPNQLPAWFLWARPQLSASQQLWVPGSPGPPSM